MAHQAFSEKLKKLPEIIESPIRMSAPNSSIKIFEGDFIIQHKEIEVTVTGSVYFEFLPQLRASFSGKPKIVPNSFLSQIVQFDPFEIFVESFKIGTGYITDTNIGTSHQEPFIEGICDGSVFMGDSTIPVENVIFSIPNLRNFLGNPVKKQKGPTSISSLSNRIELENESIKFILDKSPEYKELDKSLRKKGGYVLQYSGELRSKKGPMLFKDIEDSFHCLNTFLNFINGRRTSALFRCGFVGEQLKWSDYSSYPVNSYKYVHSWPTTLPDLSNMWRRFSALWKNKNDKDFLTSAIHWYVEVNNNAGYIEGSIIMAQTALELIYNWWIVEDKKLIIGEDSKKLSASNKIRLLLSQLNIVSSNPESFNSLEELVGKNNVDDAPEAMVFIRNAIVHSNKNKRTRLLTIASDAKNEALQLSIWYIEMALLRILEFDGKYADRITKKTNYVPWSNEKIND